MSGLNSGSDCVTIGSRGLSSSSRVLSGSASICCMSSINSSSCCRVGCNDVAERERAGVDMRGPPCPVSVVSRASRTTDYWPLLDGGRSEAILANLADRFYVNCPLALGSITLEGPEAHHLATVCRLRRGNRACLLNGDGQEYLAEVRETRRS